MSSAVEGAYSYSTICKQTNPSVARSNSRPRRRANVVKGTSAAFEHQFTTTPDGFVSLMGWYHLAALPPNYTGAIEA